MNSIVDTDQILSENEHWKKLEEQWGIPIDLEVDESDDQPKLRPVFSCLDLKTTFDSSFLFKKVRRKLGRQLSKTSTKTAADYQDFLNHLHDPSKESSQQFLCIQNAISASSVEEICKKIDDIFRSIEKLSTCSIRKPKVKLPEIVHCSISASDLSFDDTVQDESHYDSEIDRHMEEAFHDLSTIKSTEHIDKSTLESVTTLVRKFSSILEHPTMKHSARRQKQCSEKFRDLAEFWKSHAFNTENM
ncbi:uncharacterized protein LOC125054555 [Pieris napi]|uniref:uncharacterized protein LOC125054555 n=1 Tax=Pieris napi TaxID=78633 RepID=UPI001FBB1DD8|nr:uncharacterized protein LOC125054555 [Pieris napi]